MKTISNKNRISEIFLIIVICLLLSACFAEIVPTEEEILQVTESIVVTRYEETIVASSISELVLQSDLVVIGKIISIGDIVNMARNPDDISKPDPNYYGIGQVFDVEIERYLVGGGSKAIHIVQDQGFLRTDSSDISLDSIKLAIKKHTHHQIEVGDSYLLFLRVIPHDVEGYPKGSLFAPAAYPWLFITEDNNAVSVVDDKQTSAQNLFPPKALNEIILEIKNPKLQNPPTPYPAPSGVEEDVNKINTPYP